MNAWQITQGQGELIVEMQPTQSPFFAVLNLAAGDYSSERMNAKVVSCFGFAAATHFWYFESLSYRVLCNSDCALEDGGPIGQQQSPFAGGYRFSTPEADASGMSPTTCGLAVETGAKSLGAVFDNRYSSRTGNATNCWHLGHLPEQVNNDYSACSAGDATREISRIQRVA
jgi:hypothetical protein